MSEHTKELRDLFTATLFLAAPLLVLVLAIVGIVLLSHNPTTYAHSLDMKEQLLTHTPGARVILMGGSGAASSIDSQTLKKTIHKEPVNMGLFAGVGMRFITNEMKNKIHEGDIILLAPEYEMLQQPSYGDGFLLLQMLEANPKKLPDVLTPHGVIVMTRAFPNWVQFQGKYLVKNIRNYFRPQTPTVSERLYTLANITKYGDLDTSSFSDVHLSQKEITDVGNGFVRPHIDPTNLSLITSLARSAQQKNARLFVVLPAVPASVETSNLSNITSQYNELVAALGAQNVIGAPGYFIFPNTQFLDSIGHLTYSGKAARTELIRRKLEQHLNTP